MIKTVSFEAIEPLIIEKLNHGSTAELTVKGSSMYPFYVDGLTSVVLGKAKAPYKKNQVVIYHTSIGVVMHRIRKIEKDHLVTCGDSLKEFEHIEVDSIFALVLSHKTKKWTKETKRSYLFRVRLWYLLKPFRRILLGLIRRIDSRGKKR